MLANAIRANPNIKGIIVKNTEIKICQYADDTTLTLDGSEKSFQEALSMLETFGNVSGLRLNYKKTEAFWIGSMSNSKVVLFPEKNLKWPEQKVKTLGVWFSNDPQISLSLNILENWKRQESALPVVLPRGVSEG